MLNKINKKYQKNLLFSFILKFLIFFKNDNMIQDIATVKNKKKEEEKGKEKKGN